jgi:predicted metal-dependent hydrolase
MQAQLFAVPLGYHARLPNHVFVRVIQAVIICYASGKHVMEFDWTTGALADGLRCYRNQEFFLAHEYWESIWLQCRQPEKTFVQALIQLACAFHHFQRDNLRGATSQLTASLRKLQNYPDDFAGLEVAPLREEMGGWLLALAAEEPRTYPPIPQVRRLLPPE